MTPEPFTLDNAGGPEVKREHPQIWKPHSQAAINRQTLHTILQKDISVQHSLDSLVIATGLPRKAVYAAARTLVLKGLAGRKDSVEVVTDGEKSSQKRVIWIKGHELFGKLVKTGW